MAEEINKEELFEGVELTADPNDLPAIETEVTEEAPVAEEKPKKKVAKKAPAKKAPAKKAPGMYFEGRLIEAVPARLGRRWTVIIDGVRHKVPKEEIEIVE